MNNIKVSIMYDNMDYPISTIDEKYITCYPPKMSIKYLKEKFSITRKQAEYIYKNWRREYLKRYGLNELEYYGNILDIIVNLLNNSNNAELQEYLLNKYNIYYEKYEKLRIKEYKKNGENKKQTYCSMDWI